MAEWFEDWFNSKYYHILYQQRDDMEAQRFIQNLVDNIKLKSNSRVLDLACGRGRHSIFLNSLGYHTTGVDLSSASIEFAKKYENDQLSFFVRDMREPLALGNFDLVLNLFTSFGYFSKSSDNLKLLNSVHDYLSDSGNLIIDFFNAVKVENSLVESEVKKMDGIEFKIQRKITGDFIVKTIEFSDAGQDFCFEEKVQLFQLTDFQELLNKSGFIISSVFGDYNLGKFDTKNSDRLIIVARKK